MLAKSFVWPSWGHMLEGMGHISSTFVCKQMLNLHFLGGNWVNSFKSTFLGSSFQLGDRTASGHVYRLAWTNHPLLAVEIPTLQDRVPRESLQRFHTELGWKSTLRWIPLVSPGIVLSSRKPIRNARTILVPSNTWSNWSNAKDPVWIASGFSASQPGNISKRKFQYQLVNR